MHGVYLYGHKEIGTLIAFIVGIGCSALAIYSDEKWSKINEL